MTDNVENVLTTKLNDIVGEVREINERVEKSSASFAAKEELAALESKMNSGLDNIEKMRASMQAPSINNEEAESTDATYKSAFDSYFRKGKEEALDMEIKAMSAGTDADGGYLVPNNARKLIIGQMFESSPMRQYASVQSITGEGLDVNIDNDEAAAGWVAETAARPDTDTPQIARKTINAYELYASPKATQRLLDDSEVNIEQWLAGKVSEIFSRTENTAFVSGNGTNKPTGILDSVGTAKLLTAADAYSATEAESYKTGVAGSFGANDGTAADNLLTFLGKLKADYASNAILIGNRGTRAALTKLRTGAGDYVFKYDAEKGLTIDGVPFVSFNDMPAMATDALALGVADMKRAYQIVDRTGVRVLRDPFTDKPYVKFYTTKRVGGDVVNYEAIKFLKLSV